MTKLKPAAGLTKAAWGIILTFVALNIIEFIIEFLSSLVPPLAPLLPLLATVLFGLRFAAAASLIYILVFEEGAFYRTVAFLMLFYLVLKHFVNYVMPPLPQSLILMYLSLLSIAIYLFLSLFEEKIREFFEPMLRFSRSVVPTATYARWTVLALLPLLMGMNTYNRLAPSFVPPLEQRVIHPAPPREFALLRNPVAHTPENIAAGRGLFIAFCAPCHGSELNGKGPAARGFNPPPANFVDPGTIAQLQESYLFWRISTGGVGLPVEGKPWNSAMPRWETRISPENIWRIIMYEYEGSGHKPRTWED